MKRLPDKPSALILLALADLERVENDPRYKIDMGDWHQPNGKCAVCLAGSVIAGTLKESPRVHREPWDYDDDTASKLCALDDFRQGWIADGLDQMGCELPDAYLGNWVSCQHDMTSYHTDREAWLQEMQTIVGILQAEGL